MKCQHCHNEESELSIRFDYKGYEWDVHLCESCASDIRQITERALAEYWGQVPVGARGAEAASNEALFPAANSAPVPARRSISPLPDDAGEKFRARRRLSELRALLDEAVGAEQYEEAARLRDSIKQFEKGVCSYE